MTIPNWAIFLTGVLAIAAANFVLVARLKPSDRSSFVVGWVLQSILFVAISELGIALFLQARLDFMVLAALLIPILCGAQTFVDALTYWLKDKVDGQRRERYRDHETPPLDFK